MLEKFTTADNRHFTWIEKKPGGVGPGGIYREKFDPRLKSLNPQLNKKFLVKGIYKTAGNGANTRCIFNREDLANSNKIQKHVRKVSEPGSQLHETLIQISTFAYQTIKGDISYRDANLAHAIECINTELFGLVTNVPKTELLTVYNNTSGTTHFFIKQDFIENMHNLPIDQGVYGEYIGSNQGFQPADILFLGQTATVAFLTCLRDKIGSKGQNIMFRMHPKLAKWECVVIDCESKPDDPKLQTVGLLPNLTYNKFKLLPNYQVFFKTHIVDRMAALLLLKCHFDKANNIPHQVFQAFETYYQGSHLSFSKQVEEAIKTENIFAKYKAILCKWLTQTEMHSDNVAFYSQAIDNYKNQILENFDFMLKAVGKLIDFTPAELLLWEKLDLEATGIWKFVSNPDDSQVSVITSNFCLSNLKSFFKQRNCRISKQQFSGDVGTQLLINYKNMAFTLKADKNGTTLIIDKKILSQLNQDLFFNMDFKNLATQTLSLNSQSLDATPKRASTPIGTSSGLVSSDLISHIKDVHKRGTFPSVGKREGHQPSQTTLKAPGSFTYTENKQSTLFIAKPSTKNTQTNKDVPVLERSQSRSSSGKLTQQYPELMLKQLKEEMSKKNNAALSPN